MLRASRPRGFTLIELLTVMVIIAILAALVLALVGYGHTKAAKSKAEGEIAAMSSALESYKTDNGTYPRVLPTTSTANTTPNSDCDNLDARTHVDPTTADSTLYISANMILYRSLTGDWEGKGSDSTTAPQKTYYNVPESEQGKDKSGFRYILDPFGNPYGYSTAYQAELDAGHTPPNKGYNPTFDLWSTNGYGSTPKAYPADMGTADKRSTLWTKNW